MAPRATGPMQSVPQANLLPGQGIEGDRYAAGTGTFSSWPRDHELTLIEAEVIEEQGINLAPEISRRNLTTRGVRLNTLVGNRFRIGEALCEGTRLCEPCAHLERVTAREGLVRLLAGRGGLRARILIGGKIAVGDALIVESES